MSSERTLRDRFKAGERVALARVLSYVEDHPDLSGTWIAALPPVSNAIVIGVTGPPGAGKSTLSNALVGAYRQAGKTVAVLAFDPSSKISGGAALGDRIRMNETWSDDGVYIRSLASRGRLGGLSDAVFGALRALDAFGVEVILIETVGVGQGEIEVAEIADVTILIQVPGAGDTIQLIKAGVLEIADILVVNKADLPGAGELLRDLRSLVTQVDPGKAHVAVLPTTATTIDGVTELVTAIEAAFARAASRGMARALADLKHYVISDVERQLQARLSTAAGAELVRAVCRGEVNAWEARARLMRDIHPG